MFKQIKNYINTLWIVLNNKHVINKIKRLNKRNKADTITMFDFALKFLRANF